MTQSSESVRRALIDAIDRAVTVQRGDFVNTGGAVIDSCSRIADYFYDTSDPDRRLWRELFIKVFTQGPWAGSTMNPIGSKLVEVAGRRAWTEEMEFAREQLTGLAAGKPIAQAASQGRQGGCYAATAMYGSCNCLEVWVLRRFRDEFLLSHRGGYLLVRGYYAFGPLAVRYGGSLLSRLAHRATRSPSW
jgi:hypothetical protein